MTFAFDSPTTIYTFSPRFVFFFVKDIDVHLAKTLRHRHGATLHRAYPPRIDNRCQSTPAHVVVERLHRGPLRLIPELGPHPGGVHHPSITHVVELVAVELATTGGAHQRIEGAHADRGHRHPDAARAPD